MRRKLEDRHSGIFKCGFLFWDLDWALKVTDEDEPLWADHDISYAWWPVVQFVPAFDPFATGSFKDYYYKVSHSFLRFGWLTFKSDYEILHFASLSMFGFETIAKEMHAFLCDTIEGTLSKALSDAVLRYLMAAASKSNKELMRINLKDFLDSSYPNAKEEHFTFNLKAKENFQDLNYNQRLAKLTNIKSFDKISQSKPNIITFVDNYDSRSYAKACCLKHGVHIYPSTISFDAKVTYNRVHAVRLCTSGDVSKSSDLSCPYPMAVPDM